MDVLQRNGRLIALTLLTAMLGIACQSVAAERTELERAVSVALQHNNQPLRGQMIAWQDEQFEVRQPNGSVVTIRWNELPARQVAALHARVFGNTNRGEDQITLARRLSQLDDTQAETLMQQAIRRAVRLDEALEAPGQQIVADRQARLDGAAADSSQPMQELPPEEQAQAVEELIAFAEAGARRVDIALQLYETEYFLFCTDLPPAEARQWNNLLDRMYTMLLREFDLPDDFNLWRGKALVFMFSDVADYHRFQREVHNVDPRGSSGMCHGFASGKVHIAMYRHSNDRHDVAHTLVHEATHGFVFRYRTQVPVVSWINEGLAEWAAMRLVPETGRAEVTLRRTQAELRRRGSLGGFFETPQIAPWQYGVAYTLTEYMITQNSAAYVNFFQAIKDGKPWQEAIEEDYGVTLERLVAAYGRAMGVDNLTP